jgi:hypothetical protein
VSAAEAMVPSCRSIRCPREEVQAYRDEIHLIVIRRDLSEFRYLHQQLAYLVFCRIILIASRIGELFASYHEYLAKSVGKQGIACS